MTGKGDYEVGYGRPPQEHRFKKGQSGNPRGRPRGARNFKTDVVETLKAPVPIMENGRARTVSTQQAMLLRLREKALKGDAKALGLCLQLAGAYNNEEPSPAAHAQLPDTDRAIIDRSLARISRNSTGAADSRGQPDSAVAPVSTGGAQPERPTGRRHKGSSRGGDGE